MGERIFKPEIRSSRKAANNVRDGGWISQVFYDWMVTVVDDFGRYEADPAILRPLVFPLLLELVREADVSRCLQSCAAAGLIRLYTVAGKDYLEFTNWKQRLRASKSKWPSPAGQCRDNVVTMPTETETSTDTETETEGAPARDANKIAADTGLAPFMNPEIRGMLRNLVIIAGPMRARGAIERAIGKKGPGKGAVQYAAGIIRGEMEDEKKNGHPVAQKSLKDRAKSTKYAS